MIIFSKNNYKYFIGFLITFIFIVLVYGNYNLKINIIETLNCDQSSDVTENTQTTTELGSEGRAVDIQVVTDYQSKQGCSDVNS
tara:strand:- start:3381 stop:3632 length:252 start_codon:yes stop_codon:yes gene_type:complete